MKKINSKLQAMLMLLCLVFIFTDCKNDQQDLFKELDQEQALVADDKQTLETNTIDVLFNYLSRQENLQDLSIHDQFLLLQDFAIAEGLNFDINPAIKAYEDGLDQYHVITQEEEFILAEFARINELISTHGYSSELLPALQQYKEDFITSSNNLEIEQSTFNIIIGLIDQANYMVSSPMMQDYISNIDPQLINGNMNSRASLKCWLARLALIAALAGCATNPYACAGVPLAIWNVEQNCGSDYVDPCLNSPNPCCGVVCIQGYTCNSNGDCVIDPFFDCTITGCPPGEQCLNNLCVPL